jgi:hypothetical protein
MCFLGGRADSKDAAEASEELELSEEKGGARPSLYILHSCSGHHADNSA